MSTVIGQFDCDMTLCNFGEANLAKFRVRVSIAIWHGRFFYRHVRPWRERHRDDDEAMSYNHNVYENRGEKR